MDKRRALLRAAANVAGLLEWCVCGAVLTVFAGSFVFSSSPLRDVHIGARISLVVLLSCLMLGMCIYGAISTFRQYKIASDWAYQLRFHDNRACSRDDPHRRSLKDRISRFLSGVILGAASSGGPDNARHTDDMRNDDIGAAHNLNENIIHKDYIILSNKRFAVVRVVSSALTPLAVAAFIIGLLSFTGKAKNIAGELVMDRFVSFSLMALGAAATIVLLLLPLLMPIVGREKGDWSVIDKALASDNFPDAAARDDLVSSSLHGSNDDTLPVARLHVGNVYCHRLRACVQNNSPLTMLISAAGTWIADKIALENGVN